MATKKEEVVEKKEEVVVDDGYVEIPPLFYDKERYSAPVSVIVNGKAYLIPRGKAGIRVPKVVKEVLEQSEYQKQMATNFIRNNEGIKNLGEF